MNRRYDLAEMLREIEQDEEVSGDGQKRLTQDEIRKMAMRRRRETLKTKREGPAR